MDVLNTYIPLQEEIFYKSLENKVLTILPSGVEGAWLTKKNEEYNWVGNCFLGFDILEKFDFIREAMLGKSLTVSFQKKLFQVELSYRTRVGGYKEPLEEVCVVSAAAHSLVQALNLLNKKLCKEEIDSISTTSPQEKRVVDFGAYKLNRKLKIGSKRKERI